MNDDCLRSVERGEGRGCGKWQLADDEIEETTTTTTTACTKLSHCLRCCNRHPHISNKKSERKSERERKRECERARERKGEQEHLG